MGFTGFEECDQWITFARLSMLLENLCCFCGISENDISDAQGISTWIQYKQINWNGTKTDQVYCKDKESIYYCLQVNSSWKVCLYFSSWALQHGWYLRKWTMPRSAFLINRNQLFWISYISLYLHKCLQFTNKTSNAIFQELRFCQILKGGGRLVFEQFWNIYW